MYARIICADESLNKKDRELKEQKEMSTRNEGRLREDLRKLQEDVTFFKAQVGFHNNFKRVCSLNLFVFLVILSILYI